MIQIREKLIGQRWIVLGGRNVAFQKDRDLIIRHHSVIFGGLSVGEWIEINPTFNWDWLLPDSVCLFSGHYFTLKHAIYSPEMVGVPTTLLVTPTRLWKSQEWVILMAQKRASKNQVLTTRKVLKTDQENFLKFRSLPTANYGVR